MAAHADGNLFVYDKVSSSAFDSCIFLALGFSTLNSEQS